MTLLETLIGLFLLTAGILILVQLFDSGLRYMTRSTTETLAASVAEKRMDQVRAWSRVAANFDTLSSFPGLGTFQADPQWPDFATRVDLAYAELYAPDSGSEKFRPVNRRRVIDSSFAKVRVTVRWQPGDPSKQVELLSGIAEPHRQWNASTPLVVSSVPSATAPVPQGGTVDLSVSGLDSAGRTIPDLMFNWDVVPVTSSGIIQAQTRDGRTATFLHQIPKVGGGNTFAKAGEVWLVVSARYWGKPASATVVLNLQ